MINMVDLHVDLNPTHYLKGTAKLIESCVLPSGVRIYFQSYFKAYFKL